MKRLKNGTWKYRNVTIVPTPLGTYPEMVTILKAPKRLNELVGKKYINLFKTQVAIETVTAEKLIEAGAGSVEKQLESLGKGKFKNE